MQVTDRGSSRRLVLTAFRAKAKLSAVAAGLDGHCRRMNTGLAAVALVLGIVLLDTIAVRGAELVATAMVLMGEHGLPIVGWAY